MMKRQRRITKAYFDFARRQYSPLIQQLSFLIGANTQQVEELKGRGDEELLKCMICYQQGGAFITFLHYRLMGTFRHLRDTEYRAKRIRNIPPNAMINVASPDHNIDSQITIQECLECLDDEERIIITELFFNGKTMREASTNCGIVSSTICRIKKIAIGKMKEKCQIGSG